MRLTRWAIVRVSLLALLAVLASCHTIPPQGGASLGSVVREVPGADQRWQRLDNVNVVGIRVRRGDAELPVRLRMDLLPGDLLTTSDNIAAVLEFGSGVGQVVVGENTQVRLGSLEVIFGRIFADLRGLFRVHSETIEAVNDGTRYLYEVRADRNVRIVVSEGSLTCRSPRGAWPPVRLNRGQALLVSYPGREAPRPMPGDPREVDTDLQQITRARKAPVQGWCCENNVIREGSDNTCSGRFSTSKESVEAFCRPPPPANWCCLPSGQVGQISVARCQEAKGKVYDTEATARQYCKR